MRFVQDERFSLCSRRSDHFDSLEVLLSRTPTPEFSSRYFVFTERPQSNSVRTDATAAKALSTKVWDVQEVDVNCLRYGARS